MKARTLAFLRVPGLGALWGVLNCGAAQGSYHEWCFCQNKLEQDLDPSSGAGKAGGASSTGVLMLGMVKWC